ncbi:RpiB/LacA/LacB family sugar-phosphate isomerase [bacterium]|nr:MAG: RpiB/LacA/LacB family sugar-phosphate isomerase [bacterium]
MIYIGADHGGYKLKEHLKKILAKRKLDFKDMGALTFKPDDDYPDYAAKVAKQVSKNPLGNLGILICRSGQGVCIVANKFKGVRAALVWNTSEAKASRNDDMSNVLCLPSDYVNSQAAEKIMEVWIDTKFSTESRHMRRVKKISALEN